MPRLSFRLKLLLAMMLVVLGITVATTLAAQDRMQSLYMQSLQSDFASRTDRVLLAQKSRLGAIQGKCADFVASVRMVALLGAYEENPEVESAEILYQTARDQLRITGAGSLDVSSSSLFLILDHEGRVIQDPALSSPPIFDAALGEILKQAVRVGASQIIGYYPLPQPKQGLELNEVILTPIVDPALRKEMGALVLAFPWDPSSNMEARGGQSLNQGIWTVGNFFWSPDRPDPFAGGDGLAQSLDVPAIARGEGALEDAASGRMFLSVPISQGRVFPDAYLVSVYSLRAYEEQRGALRRAVLAFAGAATFLALLASLLLANGLSAPIHDLVDATRRVAEGRFDVRVPLRSNDELGDLGSSFNQMAADLELKERYRSILDLVADKAVASDLLSGMIELGGEERRVGVLFCDIRGFTAISERMTPPDIISMLNEHFTPLTEVVHRHGGVVDKFVGDLIMAIFGAPKTISNPGMRAAACALEMIEWRRKLNEASGRVIEVGIGVATGTVVAGRMGSNNRLNYTVLGAKVNLASRLCGKAGRMETLIDEETALEIDPSAAWAEPLPPLELKGLAGTVTAFRLLPARHKELQPNPS